MGEGKTTDNGGKTTDNGGKSFVVKYAQDKLGVSVTNENREQVYKDNVGKVTNAIRMLMYDKVKQNE